MSWRLLVVVFLSIFHSRRDNYLFSLFPLPFFPSSLYLFSLLLFIFFPSSLYLFSFFSLPFSFFTHTRRSNYLASPATVTSEQLSCGSRVVRVILFFHLRSRNLHDYDDRVYFHRAVSGRGAEQPCQARRENGANVRSSVRSRDRQRRHRRELRSTAGDLLRSRKRTAVGSRGVGLVKRDERLGWERRALPGSGCRCAATEDAPSRVSSLFERVRLR